jgi:hypothetical protein
MGSFLLGRDTPLKTTWVFSVILIAFIEFVHTNSIIPSIVLCHIELSVDSSLGHPTVCPSKRHRWSRRRLGRH